MMPPTSAHATLAPALADALRAAAQTLGLAEDLTVASRPTSQSNDPGQLRAALTLGLRFTGALEGELLLCPEPALSRLLLPATDTPNQEEVAAVWQKLCQAATADLLMTLQGTWGELQLGEWRVLDLPAGAAAMGDLAVGEQGSTTGSIFLLGDPTLAGSLARSRVAGDAAGTPTLQQRVEALPFAQASAPTAPLSRVIGVPLTVTLRFGQRQLTLRELLDLNTGSLVELDQQVEEPVHLMLGERVIARGEVVIVDGNYGMRVLEVVENAAQRLLGES